MCVVSMIYDMYKPLPNEWYTLDRIELFKDMVKTAEVFDKETGQPDCADPEKAKIKERIDELEKELVELKYTLIYADRSHESEIKTIELETELENEYRGADYD